MSTHGMASLLLLATGLRRTGHIEVMGIGIIFAILVMGTMLLRGRIPRVTAIGILVAVAIGAIAIWSACL